MQRKYLVPDPDTCDFDGCDRPHRRRGFCDSHYAQLQRTGRLWKLRGDVSLAERLESKRTVDPTTGCWLWTGGRFASGYGCVTIGGKSRLLHRVAHELYVGPIPDRETVHHTCATQLCFCPDHLQLATQRENLGEMFARKALLARIADLENEVAELKAKLAKR